MTDRTFIADKVSLRLVEFSPHPPTELGYHWLKEGEDAPVIVQVFEMRGCGGLLYTKDGRDYGVEQARDALWFGPLQPPGA